MNLHYLYFYTLHVHYLYFYTLHVRYLNLHYLYFYTLHVHYLYFYTVRVHYLNIHIYMTVYHLGLVLQIHHIHHVQKTHHIYHNIYTVEYNLVQNNKVQCLLISTYHVYIDHIQHHQPLPMDIFVEHVPTMHTHSSVYLIKSNIYNSQNPIHNHMLYTHNSMEYILLMYSVYIYYLYHQCQFERISMHYNHILDFFHISFYNQTLNNVYM